MRVPIRQNSASYTLWYRWCALSSDSAQLCERVSTEPSWGCRASPEDDTSLDARAESHQGLSTVLVSTYAGYVWLPQSTCRATTVLSAASTLNCSRCTWPFATAWARVIQRARLFTGHSATAYLGLRMLTEMGHGLSIA
jgi:hypothetical protein